MRVDVLVVGGGNAAMSAAFAARERGASVLVLERAPELESGGNSRFTAGGMRFAYRGAQDIRAVVPDLTDSEVAASDFGSYSEEEFFSDMARVTAFRASPDLVEALVRDSREAITWLSQKGVRFIPNWGRQSFLIDGVSKFYGGLTVEAWGGGPGLVSTEHDIAKNVGIRVLYGSPAVGLISSDAGIKGVVARINGKETPIQSNAVVLATGGFQANAEWRTRYLGPGWDMAKVRGTKFNTGEGHRMALEIGARSTGQWSGCHAVTWDRNAPTFGDLLVGDGFQKYSYPFGIMVNENGRRFLDEGLDFRAFTYAKYGREVLRQPNHTAWQVFDATADPLLRDEYRIREVTKVDALSLEELGRKMEGVNAGNFVDEVEAFNEAVVSDRPFNPAILDGRATNGLTINKTNWANRIETPPFVAYGVTCGITFTFGGIEITADAQVVSSEGKIIPGLFAAGEIVGGLFYYNYPSGTGLMAGTVFGRRAGYAAAALDRAS